MDKAMLRSLVVEIFDTKQKIMEEQNKLKFNLLPELFKSLIEAKMFEYLSLNHAKLYRDFVRN